MAKPVQGDRRKYGISVMMCMNAGGWMDWFLLVVLAVGLSLAMAASWVVQRMTGRSGWIDTIWSFAVSIGGVTASVFANGAFGRRMTILVIVAAWALRLGSHIGKRTKGADEEDPRYAKLMEAWGDSAGWRLFLFLQVQALAAFILVLAIYLAAANDEAFPGGQDFLAMFIALAALAGETISDEQLSRFRKEPQAKTEVCEVGFWRYSRHPNYFFEWLFWCCWPAFAVSTSLSSLLSLLAPALMYWLLVHVSGIPPLEEHMLHSRGDKFRALQRRVNAFFPGPRKTQSRLSGE